MRRIFTLVGGISRLMYLILLLSSDWRRTKLFDAPQSTRARSDMSFATSRFKVMRETSLPNAVTHNDCVLVAILVKRPANSLGVAGSVGCSATTDPDRFLVVRFSVSFLQQRRTHAWDPSWPLDGYCFLRYVEPSPGHWIHMYNALAFDTYCMSAIYYNW